MVNTLLAYREQCHRYMLITSTNIHNNEGLLNRVDNFGYPSPTAKPVSRIVYYFDTGLQGIVEK